MTMLDIESSPDVISILYNPVSMKINFMVIRELLYTPFENYPLYDTFRTYIGLILGPVQIRGSSAVNPGWVSCACAQ